MMSDSYDVETDKQGMVKA